MYGLATSLIVASLALYALWLQKKTHREHVRDIQVKDNDLLDRLMFATGNQSYVRTKSQEVAENQPTKEENIEREEWRELG